MIESEPKQYENSVLKAETENFKVDVKDPRHADHSMISKENNSLKRRPDFVGIQKYSKMIGRLRQRKS